MYTVNVALDGLDRLDGWKHLTLGGYFPARNVAKNNNELAIAKHRQELTLHGAGTCTPTLEHERMSRTTALAHHPNEEKIHEQEQ